jgi:hypothetical protein
MVKVLIDNHARLNARTAGHGTAALHLLPDLTIMNDLLDHGADIDIPNAKRENTLHLACSQRLGEVAKRLIARGANVSARNRQGQTQLHVNGLLDVARDLVAQGADRSAKDKDGHTPLWAYCEDSRIDSSAGSSQLLNLVRFLANTPKGPHFEFVAVTTAACPDSTFNEHCRQGDILEIMSNIIHERGNPPYLRLTDITGTALRYDFRVIAWTVLWDFLAFRLDGTAAFLDLRDANGYTLLEVLRSENNSLAPNDEFISGLLTDPSSPISLSETKGDSLPKPSAGHFEGQ